MQIDVLGTLYTITFRDADDDDVLKGADGYTDHTSKEIVIVNEKPKETSVKDFPQVQRATIRHELLHAFLYESGLASSAEYGRIEGDMHPEMIIDWFALQFPKILRAYKDAEAI